MKHGEVLDSSKCDMPCAGTVIGEYCGGRDKITAYEIKKHLASKYIGCYADAPARSMDAEGKYVTGDMTNEVSVCEKHVMPIFLSAADSTKPTPYSGRPFLQAHEGVVENLCAVSGPAQQLMRISENPSHVYLLVAKVCISYCADKGHAYAGTQYAHEVRRRAPRTA